MKKGNDYVDIYNLSLHDFLKITGVDNIEDDYSFCIAESDAVEDWCYKNDFKISDKDMEEIIGRGLYDFVQDAKEDYYYFKSGKDEKPSVLKELKSKQKEIKSSDEMNKKDIKKDSKKDNTHNKEVR